MLNKNLNSVIGVFSVLISLQGFTAQAEEAAPVATAPKINPIPAPEKSDAYGKVNRPLGDFVVGPYVGLIALPRPFSFGVEAKYIDLIGVSADYGFLPQLTLSSVKAKITGIEGKIKLYPFKGSFFLGVGFGSQTFTGSSTQDISISGTSVSTTATVNQKNSFVAPQIGWNWIWDSGFFMGMDLGVQLSMSRTTTSTTNITDPLVLASAQYTKMQKDVSDLAEQLGKIPLPLLTLIKVGYFF